MISPDCPKNTLEPKAEPRLCGNRPRHARVLRALTFRPLMREELDSIAGASNGPEIVSALRASGWAIRCDRVERLDRDGKLCRPGRYALDPSQYNAAKEATR